MVRPLTIKIEIEVNAAKDFRLFEPFVIKGRVSEICGVIRHNFILIVSSLDFWFFASRQRTHNKR